ncbi:MAG: DnaJ domain-containing protein [Gallionella sp.]|jgi:molecular chaperone DnaJ|nr:DnaJ domain-containing protein [Gallionella sp.]
MENLYNILGVAPNASTDEIKKRYRALAMRYHPDRNSDAGADVRFNAIQQAYEVLAEPKRRAEYDQKLNDRIVLDAEAEAYELWKSVFKFNGVELDRGE